MNTCIAIFNFKGEETKVLGSLVLGPKFCCSYRLPWWLRWYRTCLQCRRPRFSPWAGKIPWRREWLSLQYFCLENSMDRGTWWATVHEVTKGSDTTDWLSLLLPLCYSYTEELEFEPTQSDFRIYNYNHYIVKWWKQQNALVFVLQFASNSKKHNKEIDKYPFKWSIQINFSYSLQDKPCHYCVHSLTLRPAHTLTTNNLIHIILTFRIIFKHICSSLKNKIPTQSFLLSTEINISLLVVRALPN